MIRHHPDQNILADFAAGSLAPAFAVGVRAHLHYCEECRDRVQQFEQIGAGILDAAEPVAIDEKACDNLFELIDASTDKSTDTSDSTNTADTTSAPVSRTRGSATQHGAPAVITKLLGSEKIEQGNWRTLSPSLKRIQLAPGENGEAINLYRIKPGGKIPAHEHRGDELTLVLKGSFSDQKGVYQQGDFLLRSSGDSHRPLASQDEEGICFAVEASSPRFTGPLGKLLNFAIG